MRFGEEEQKINKNGNSKVIEPVFLIFTTYMRCVYTPPEPTGLDP